MLPPPPLPDPPVWIAGALGVCALAGLGALAAKHRRVLQFWLKSGVTLGCILLVTGLGMLVSAACAATGQRGNINHYVGRLFVAIMAPLVGVSFSIEGQAHLDAHRPCVFICNHQSSLDMLTMAAVFPRQTVVMAKKSISYIPFFGSYLKLAKNVFIDRKNHASSMETLATVAAYMSDERVALFVYPEGTRSHQTRNDLLPFKKGAFHVAIRGGMPIVPILFSTYAPEVDEGYEDDEEEEGPPPRGTPPHLAADAGASRSRSRSFNRLLGLENEHRPVVYSSRLKRFDGGTIRIKVLPPIPTSSLQPSDLSSLMSQTRAVMMDTLREISEPVLVHSPKKKR